MMATKLRVTNLLLRLSGHGFACPGLGRGGRGLHCESRERDIHLRQFRNICHGFDYAPSLKPTKERQELANDFTDVFLCGWTGRTQRHRRRVETERVGRDCLSTARYASGGSGSSEVCLTLQLCWSSCRRPDSSRLDEQDSKDRFVYGSWTAVQESVFLL